MTVASRTFAMIVAEGPIKIIVAEGTFAMTAATNITRGESCVESMGHDSPEELTLSKMI